MSEISSQFTFEQLGPGKLIGNLEGKTDPLVRKWPQGTANHIVVANQKVFYYDIIGGSLPLEFGRVEVSPGLLLWQHR
jgi:hypothetical protein